MNKKKLASTVTLALMASILSVALSVNMSHGFEASVFQVSVQSPQNRSTVRPSFSVNFSFEIPPMQTMIGFTVNPGNYLINGAPSDLFASSIFAGCVVDYDRAKVVDLISNDSGAFDATNAFVHQGVTPVLSYSGEEIYNGTATLTGLRAGSHTLVIWVKAVQNSISFYGDIWSAFSQTVNFTVDNSPLNIEVLSPQNEAYNNGTNIPVELTVNDPLAQIACTLDGQNNVTLNETTQSPLLGHWNGTLTGLAIGAHNLTVSARDIAETFLSTTTTTFQIAEAATPTPQQSPNITLSPSVPEFPSMTIFLVSAIATVTVIACLKKQTSKSK